MVTLIVGKKGSGKTKKLIERANEAVKTSDGNVVVIEKGLKLTYDISHQARLVTATVTTSVGWKRWQALSAESVLVITT